MNAYVRVRQTGYGFSFCGTNSHAKSRYAAIFDKRRGNQPPADFRLRSAP